MLGTYCHEARRCRDQQGKYRIFTDSGAVGVTILLLQQIGDFFMQVLASVAQKQTSVEVAVEVLNCIYDVYSDCAFDYDEPVFVHGGYLQNLQQFLPHFRSLVSQVLEEKKNKSQRTDPIYPPAGQIRRSAEKL